MEPTFVIQLLCGVFLMSASMTYACWTVWRANCLRVSLREVHDKLLAAARTDNVADDVAVTNAAKLIRNLQECADVIGMSVMGVVLLRGVGMSSKRDLLTSKNANAQRHIDAAIEGAANAVKFYLLSCTLLGRLMWFVAGFVQLKVNLDGQVQKWSRRYVVGRESPTVVMQ